MIKKQAILLSLCIMLASCSKSYLEDHAELLQSDAQLINDGQYWVYLIDIKKSVHLRVDAELKSGPSVEIYFMDNSNYNLWETQVTNGQLSSAKFEYFQELSIIPLASSDQSQWAEVEEGRFVIIAENTDYGTVAPPDNAEEDSSLVELEIWFY